MMGKEAYGTVGDSRVAREDSYRRGSAQRVDRGICTGSSLEGKGAEGDDED